MVPLIIHSIYTLYSGLLKGSNRGAETARVPCASLGFFLGHQGGVDAAADDVA